MKNILILGAGKSSSSLIQYALKQAVQYDWKVTVADASLSFAEEKIEGHQKGIARQLDIENEKERYELIEKTDVVISLMPPGLHYLAAKDCLRHKKHLVTASYVSEEIQLMDKEAKEAGIVMMCEMGLDPGIDHMSAMKIIDEIKASEGELQSFKSYCGGLIAPEYDDNPWHYKFTWNPRNVVLAGQGTAQFIEDGKYRYIPYNRLFEQTEIIEVPGHGKFEAYANRDSLHYRKLYGLYNIPTLFRATLRTPGYCKAWNAFVKLGWTDDTYVVSDSKNLNYSDFVKAYLPVSKETDIKKQTELFLGVQRNDEVMQKLEWLGIFQDEKIGISNATPAQILQQLLERKWKLKAGDKDMIVMQHEFIYKIRDDNKRLLSSMVLKGEDERHTAMAKTVGLPLGIFAKLLLLGKINLTGVHIPVLKSVYDPVLKELQDYNISFSEKEIICK